MKVPQLSSEARASVGVELKPLPSAHNVINRKEWVLKRARSMSLGVRLIQAEIDEIGTSLKNDWITAEQAWSDLTALEQVPVYAASVFYSQGGGE
jgi:hypothetical protein